MRRLTNCFKATTSVIIAIMKKQCRRYFHLIFAVFMCTYVREISKVLNVCTVYAYTDSLLLNAKMQSRQFTVCLFNKVCALQNPHFTRTHFSYDKRIKNPINISSLCTALFYAPTTTGLMENRFIK